MTFPSHLYADDEKFKAEAHKYLVDVFQSSIYDPEIVRKLASLEERALNEVLANLTPDERKDFLEALDSAADKHVIERILSNASDAIGIGFKNVKAKNSHLLDSILFGGSIGILPVAILYAISEDMPWLAKIPYMAVMLPIAAAILVAEAVVAAAVFLAVSPVMSAWGVVSGIRAYYKAQNSDIHETYQSLKDKSHALLDEQNQVPIAQADESQSDKKQTDKSPSFLSSLINYLAVQPGTKPDRAHRFFAVSSAEGAEAKKDIEGMRPWYEGEKPKLF